MRTFRNIIHRKNKIATPIRPIIAHGTVFLSVWAGTVNLTKILKYILTAPSNTIRPKKILARAIDVWKAFEVPARRMGF